MGGFILFLVRMLEVWIRGRSVYFLGNGIGGGLLCSGLFGGDGGLVGILVLLLIQLFVCCDGFGWDGGGESA